MTFVVEGAIPLIITTVSLLNKDFSVSLDAIHVIDRHLLKHTLEEEILKVAEGPLDHACDTIVLGDSPRLVYGPLTPTSKLVTTLPTVAQERGREDLIKVGEAFIPNDRILSVPK